MKKQQHTIQGFTLTLDHDEETIFADIEKGNFSGSLAMAEDMGELENTSGTATLPIPEKVVEKFAELEAAFSDSL